MSQPVEEAGLLGDTIGKYAGAGIAATTNLLAALVASGAIRGRQARAILDRMGAELGPEMKTTMRLKAARLMTQRPCKRH